MQKQIQDQIAAYEAGLAKLRAELASAPRRDKAPPETSHRLGWNTSQRQRSEVHRHRAEPIELTPLPGNPDDPTPPFTNDIMKAYISRKFKMPTIKTYDGTGDPANHIRTFSNALLLQPVSDAIKCRAFPQTLGGMAQRWYSRLPPNSIGSFKELSRAFIGQFISGKTHEKSSASLMNLLQSKNESLRNYINRFTKEALKVPDLDEKVAMIALQQGTTDTFFKRSLAKQAPERHECSSRESWEIHKS